MEVFLSIKEMVFVVNNYCNIEFVRVHNVKIQYISCNDVPMHLSYFDKLLVCQNRVRGNGGLGKCIDPAA